MKKIKEDWFKKHLVQIKQKAGPRYIPELNVDLPISEIFEGISRTEQFYMTIRENYGALFREFKYVSSNYKNKAFQKNYNDIKREIKKLIKLIENIKDYDTRHLPWDKIQKQTKQIQEKIWKFIEKLRKEKNLVKDIINPPREDGIYQQSLYEKYNSDIHHLYKTQGFIRYFDELSSSTKAKLSNHPFLLLTGSAGTGKTHLLCDIVERRVKNENKVLPTFLLFGEYYVNDKDFWIQTLEQLGIENIIKTKEAFLKTLDDLGKTLNCRSLFIIDALNENIIQAPNFWKNNLNNISQEIKKYQNIALIVSVRTGFENKVLTEKQKRDLIHEEHLGFRFKEWEAVNKFFNEFSLPLPEIPLLMPEFQNPLFLLLFCAAFGKKEKNLKNKKVEKIKPFRGLIGSTHIFESFVKEMADKIANEFNLPKGRDENGQYVIWDTIMKKIAAEMVRQNNYRIPEKKLITIIQNTYSQVNVGEFLHALESNMLIVKVPRYIKGDFDTEFDIKFPFQKFSDHLIGRYIFKKYEDEFGNSNKNLKTAKKFFSRRRKLGKFLSNTWNRGIIEALSIQCPEQLRGIELIEVAPYLVKNNYLTQVAEETFVESIIWRNPKAFSKDGKNTLKIINKYVIQTELGQNQLLNAFLSVAPIPNHPFNSERLHQHLSKFSMPERDSWWSIFLHYQYGEHGAVDRLLQWSWSNQDKSHIKDESIFLTSIALTWFLTTPNRCIRDKASKGLVCLLQYRTHLLLKLLEKFRDINDPYITERLFAVAYGCVLRNQEDTQSLTVLAEWIYINLFKNNKPPTHILLRDYARGIIEIALRRGIKLDIEKNKIYPPYQSKWPRKLPTTKEIEEYQFNYNHKEFKDYFWAQNSIISSMQPEHSEISMYGDFGRYTFQSALSKWDIKSKGISMQELSNWAVKEVFNLGYDVELHGNFDRNLNYYRSAEKSEHKSERIGKKYQWIAFHRILALVSDNFKFRGDSWNDSPEKYLGPWNPHVRDIDPSFILQDDSCIKESVTFSKWKSNHGDYNTWKIKNSDLEWIKMYSDLPKAENLIQIYDDNEEKWLILDGLVNWEEKNPPEYKKYEIPMRRIRYIIKSYIIKKEDSKKFFKWARKQNFFNRRKPELRDFYEIFLGEYPNSIAFKDLRENDSTWTKSWGEDNDVQTSVIVTTNSYKNEFTLDGSLNGSISIKLPCKWLLNKMELNHRHLDGRFFDNKGNLVVFPTKIFEDNFLSGLFINKQILCDFLEKNDYVIFWIVTGEKQIIGEKYLSGGYKGRLEIDGLYILNQHNIEGEFISKFRK